MNAHFIREEDNKVLENMDLIELKEKGLSEENISQITRLPIDFIKQYFDKMDQYRQKSGIF
jgi:hypothetical protein